MDREAARRQLEANVRARTQLIEGHLRPGEVVTDAGDVNELSLNTMSNLGAGEGLLFVTDQRFILYRSGSLESWERGTVSRYRLRKAPRGVPQRAWMRELSLVVNGGTRSFIGGRMFLSGVVQVLRG